MNLSGNQEEGTGLVFFIIIFLERIQPNMVFILNEPVFNVNINLGILLIIAFVGFSSMRK